ncbi:hypothetical protein NDU88_003498 [Pleurodeles waltl]|uniref:Uncharacterized protein n=1 Tax=Pleurodeles waltl TaxID=8319 RepID=A0AAV7NGV3_PLEWA|nr:hypothetical protein NDU88_003498 [Pleurodeles waltl]
MKQHTREGNPRQRATSRQQHHIEKNRREGPGTPKKTPACGRQSAGPQAKQRSRQPTAPSTTSGSKGIQDKAPQRGTGIPKAATQNKEQGGSRAGPEGRKTFATKNSLKTGQRTASKLPDTPRTKRKKTLKQERTPKGRGRNKPTAEKKSSEGRTPATKPQSLGPKTEAPTLDGGHCNSWFQTKDSAKNREQQEPGHGAPHNPKGAFKGPQGTGQGKIITRGTTSPENTNCRDRGTRQGNPRTGSPSNSTPKKSTAPEEETRGRVPGRKKEHRPQTGPEKPAGPEQHNLTPHTISKRTTTKPQEATEGRNTMQKCPQANPEAQSKSIPFGRRQHNITPCTKETAGRPGNPSGQTSPQTGTGEGPEAGRKSHPECRHQGGTPKKRVLQLQIDPEADPPPWPRKNQQENKHQAGAQVSHRAQPATRKEQTAQPIRNSNQKRTQANQNPNHIPGGSTTGTDQDRRHTAGTRPQHWPQDKKEAAQPMRRKKAAAGLGQTRGEIRQTPPKQKPQSSVQVTEKGTTPGATSERQECETLILQQQGIGTPKETQTLKEQEGKERRLIEKLRTSPHRVPMPGQEPHQHGGT